MDFVVEAEALAERVSVVERDDVSDAEALWVMEPVDDAVREADSDNDALVLDEAEALFEREVVVDREALDVGDAVEVALALAE